MPASASRRGRRPGRVAVVAGQERGPLPDRRVQRARRQPASCASDQPRPVDPGVGRRCAVRRPQASTHLGAVGASSSATRGSAAREADEVDVEVVQARDDGSVAGVDDRVRRRGRARSTSSPSPTRDDAPVGDPDRLGGLEAVGLRGDDDLAADRRASARGALIGPGRLKRGVWTKPAGSGPNAIRSERDRHDDAASATGTARHASPGRAGASPRSPTADRPPSASRKIPSP